MDGLVNGRERGEEITIANELGRYIVIECQGKQILKVQGEPFILELLAQFGKSHSWALHRLEDITGG